MSEFILLRLFYFCVTKASLWVRKMLKTLIIASLYFLEYTIITFGFLLKPIIFIARIIETLPCRPLGPRERRIIVIQAIFGFRL